MMKFLSQMLIVFNVCAFTSTAGAEVPQNNNSDYNTITAADQITKANSESIYWENTPDILFAIPILKITVDPEGFVKTVIVLRKPSNPDAVDTIDLALGAVKKSEPFKNLITNDEPVEFIQTFLFRDDRRFKLRVLD
jgi:hypothetical protein